MKIPSFIKRVFFGAISTWITAILVGKISALWTAWNTEALNYELALKQIKTCNTQRDVQTNFAEICKKATTITKHWPLLKAIETVINDFHATTDLFIYTILNSWLFVLLCLIVTGMIIFQISNFFKRKSTVNYISKLNEERKQRNEIIELIPSNDNNMLSSSSIPLSYIQTIGGAPPPILMLDTDNLVSSQKRKKQKVTFIDDDRL